VKGKPVDVPACHAKARAKFDRTTARLQGCPPCVGANAKRLADQLETLLDDTNALIYCDGTHPLLSEHYGLASDDRDAGKCQRKTAGELGRLGASLVKCHVTAAGAALAGGAFADQACESTARDRYNVKLGGLAGCADCLARVHGDPDAVSVSGS
jgi:hypothetical protein